MFGKIHFASRPAANLGAIKAENWRAWNFRIEDPTGTEIARITKTFEGIAKTLFTTADNYVVHTPRQACSSRCTRSSWPPPCRSTPR